MTGQSGKSFVRNCSEIDSSWLTELAPDYYQDKKAEIAQKRHLEEAEAPPMDIAALGEPLKKLKQESIEFGGPVMKKIEKNRDALLKKPPVNRKIMISDMDFDQ
jgi:hypothetical protein